MNIVNVQELAEADLAEARDWYASRSKSAAVDLLREFLHFTQLISELPEAFPKAHREARKATLKQFPYAIIYVVEDDRVEVIAFAHSARRPRVWKSRVPR